MLFGTAAEAPFDQFSMSRSMMPFTFDLTDRPEKVKAAAERLAPAFARNQVLSAKLMGVPRALVFVHRSGTDFISPRMFEEISLPSLKTICEILIEAGITPILHCDGNWDKNLKALRKLPPKKCIIQFDGPTNIFRAKQEIGDMHCLFGDVNAYDLVMGSPSRIDEYCHRLIEEVGRGGGFILAAGCEVPPNAKPENVKAMISAPQKYAAPD
jgi:uroporphyrinogen-III decarboxylase